MGYSFGVGDQEGKQYLHCYSNFTETIFETAIASIKYNNLKDGNAINMNINADRREDLG